MGESFFFRDPLVTHFSQNQAKDHEKCLEHLLGLLLLTEAMLESHIEAGRQHNTRYAGFHPSEKALDIPVVQQVMEQRRDQEDDQERRQDNGERGDDGSQEAPLAAPHISRQIDHDRSRCTFTDGNHIGQHVVIQPAVGQDHIPDQRNRTVCTSEGKTSDFQKSCK